MTRYFRDGVSTYVAQRAAFLLQNHNPEAQHVPPDCATSEALVPDNKPAETTRNYCTRHLSALQVS